MGDPYIVLGIPPSATWDEVRKAYRQKAHETHPDQNPGDRHALRRFAAVSAAFEQLSLERGKKEKAQYEPPPAAGAPQESAAGARAPAPGRLAAQVVMTAAVAAETAVEGFADRMSKRGGWAAVFGETLRGAARGMSEAAENLKTDAKTPRPGPK